MLFSANDEDPAFFVKQFYDFIYKTATFCCGTDVHFATSAVKSCTSLGGRSFKGPVVLLCTKILGNVS